MIDRWVIVMWVAIIILLGLMGMHPISALQHLL